MLSQGRESNPRSLLSKQSLRRCKLTSSLPAYMRLVALSTI